jgi:hypothetical protein
MVPVEEQIDSGGQNNETEISRRSSMKSKQSRQESEDEEMFKMYAAVDLEKKIC